MPMDGRTPDWDAVLAEGTTYSPTEVPPLRLFKSVSPRLFETAGTRLVAGRDFTWTDLFDHRHFVMVSENLARELWGTPAGAVGKRIRTVARVSLARSDRRRAGRLRQRRERARADDRVLADARREFHPGRTS